MQENNSIIIAMLEELLTISKSQRTEQTVNANVDLTPVKELIENGNRENKENEQRPCPQTVIASDQRRQRRDGEDAGTQQ